MSHYAGRLQDDDAPRNKGLICIRVAVTGQVTRHVVGCRAPSIGALAISTGGGGEGGGGGLICGTAAHLHINAIRSRDEIHLTRCGAGGWLVGWEMGLDALHLHRLS